MTKSSNLESKEIEIEKLIKMGMKLTEEHKQLILKKEEDNEIVKDSFAKLLEEF